jgi:hypothetical protein|tara:strand:+ start:588 stop:761 length:174 start_codon:yes stop_codon:yes gene_type:complete
MEFSHGKMKIKNHWKGGIFAAIFASFGLGFVLSYSIFPSMTIGIIVGILWMGIRQIV